MKMSPSGAFAYFQRGKFDAIPPKILKDATNYGKNFMLALAKKLAPKQCKDIKQSFSNDILSGVNSLLKLLKEHKIHIEYIEHEVSNDIWHGFIDLDCKECFIEIKTRSNKKLELMTMVQCEVYKKITGKDYKIVYLVRKTGKCEFIEPKDITKARRLIGCAETIYKELNGVK